MLKKILIIGGVLVLLAVVTILVIPWGEYESNLEKSDLDEKVEYSTAGDDNQPPSLDTLLGTYSVKSGEGVAAEILFTTDGLKNTKGAFTDFEITFDVPQDYQQSELTVSIRTASINTGNTMRDEHLLEKDFFDASNYPEITYVARSIELGDTSYVAKGKLTLNGTTRPLDVPFLHLGAGGSENDRFEAFEGAFQFDRVEYGQDASSGVGNIVRVNFYCELKSE